MKPVWCMNDCIEEGMVEDEHLPSEEARWTWAPLNTARNIDHFRTADSSKDPRLSTRRRSLLGRQRRMRNCDLPLNILAMHRDRKMRRDRQQHRCRDEHYEDKAVEVADCELLPAIHTHYLQCKNE